MLISCNGGWTPDKGKDELGLKITLVGNDPIDVGHVKSLVGDDWTVTPVLDGDTLTLSVYASRKVSLAEQAAQKAAADKAAADKAEADAKVAADKAAAEAAEDARRQRIASVAATAAVEALSKQ